MDDNLREMGVGDVTVPKRMKRMLRGALRPRPTYTRALDEGRLAGPRSRRSAATCWRAGRRQRRRLAAYVGGGDARSRTLRDGDGNSGPAGLLFRRLTRSGRRCLTKRGKPGR